MLRKSFESYAMCFECYDDNKSKGVARLRFKLMKIKLTYFLIVCHFKLTKSFESRAICFECYNDSKSKGEWK